MGNSLAPGMGGTSLNTYPRFDTWKFQDSFAGARGALDSFNLNRYLGRVFADPSVGGPPVVSDGGYVGDKGTTFTPHVNHDPRIADFNFSPNPPKPQFSGRVKDDVVGPLAFDDVNKVVAKRPNRAASAINQMVLPLKKQAVAKRQPGKGSGGVSLAGMAGRSGGGIASNPYYRNTPGSQTFGIYPQTGAQQDYSLHNPNSYTYAPNR